MLDLHTFCSLQNVMGGGILVHFACLLQQVVK